MLSATSSSANATVEHVLQSLIDEGPEVVRAAEEQEGRGLVLDRFEGLERLRVFVAEIDEGVARHASARCADFAPVR